MNLLTLFGKLDHFLNMNNICCIAFKRSSLQKDMKRSNLEIFYENYPWNYLTPNSRLELSLVLQICFKIFDQNVHFGSC
jgi:hypothetical protein